MADWEQIFACICQSLRYDHHWRDVSPVNCLTL